MVLLTAGAAAPRSRRPTGGRAGLGGALLALLAAVGCYNPTIVNGGLICAGGDGGARCPDGFQCSPVDNHCYQTGSACPTAAVTPICQEPPAAGSACNPSCQTGCACGRCNVGDDGAAVCAPFIGTQSLGQTCAPDRDDCQAGLICLLESCGARLGRCYQHCTTSAQCATGVSCDIPILDAAGNDTGFQTCDLAPQDCDPVAGGGCPATALGCYLDGAGSTICDCPHRALAAGSACDVYNDCAAGLACVAEAGVAGSHCRSICRPAASPSSCASGLRCVPTGSQYGYCAT
jgi:hypothetical protein